VALASRQWSGGNPPCRMDFGELRECEFLILTLNIRIDSRLF
jgi:hypothetical protein